MKASPCPGCEGERRQTFVVEGLDCAAEVALIEARIGGLDGVCALQASPVTGQATVVHTLGPGLLEQAFAQAGFPVKEAAPEGLAPASSRATLVAMALAAAGLAVAFASPRAAILLYLPAILVGGAAVARRGLERARQGVLDMNALMTIAVVGAMAVGQWGEGAATVVLFSLAQLLEARSRERARRALSDLMRVAPETALVRGPRGEERRPVDRVARGELVVIEPGERVPLDGLVEAGTSGIDQSPLTGESKHVTKQPGDEVLAGSINGSGVLDVRVTRPAGETTLARVLRRTLEAQASRAPSQSFVDRFARVYTPAVLALALGVALLPPLLAGGSLEAWTYRGLVLLVIACPCALVIATPVAVVSGLTAASRRGILVKGGMHLEDLGRVRGVVLDKTGTLTTGRPEVTDVLPARGTPREVLALAAALEARSAHPIGAAVVERARRGGIAARTSTDVGEIPGRGVHGCVDGREVVVGSHRLFDERGLCDHRLDAELRRLESEGKTAILVGGAETGVLGALAVTDELRPEAAEAVAELRALGLQLAVLSGDNQRTVAALTARLAIGEAHADLLPEDKVERLGRLQSRWGPTAMIGDGINDAPALAASTVGIAMGERGTDVALETADVALMSEDLRLVPFAVRLGRATRRTIRANIALSLAVKAIVLGLALAGYGSLWAAVGADMGASMLVIANGLRLLRPRDAGWADVI
jgi:Cd2+/Zn2+-exporting ATPase